MLYLGPVNSVKKSAKSKNSLGEGGGEGDGPGRSTKQISKIRETLYIYCILFVLRIFYTYSQRITYEVPTRYWADTGKN